ncbi:MAG TPA: O-antigen ligase family protein [Terriglobales bacterium]
MRAALKIASTPDSSAERTGIVGLLDQTIFCGVSGVLLFAPLAFGAVEPWALFVVEAVAALLFGLWAIRQALASELRIVYSPLFAPMLAFAGLILVQLFAGRSAYRQETIHGALLYCAYGLICFLAVQALRRSSQIRLLAYLACIYGLLVALFALFQSLSSDGKLYWVRVPRSGGWIYGPYVNHNHYAGLMEMLVPIPLVIAFSQLHGGKRQRNWAFFAAAIMAATIFLSGSRGGMLACAVELSLLAAFLFRQKKGRSTTLAFGAFLTVVVGLLVWLGGAKLSERLASIQTEATTEISGGTRLQIVHDGLKMYAARPVLGWGLGTFPDVYPQYRTFYTNLFVNQAHNDYLQLLIETGAAGFGIMMWFLALTFYRAVRKLKNWPSDINGTMSLIALLGVSGILVHSCVDFNLQIPANALLFYVLCVVAALEPRFSTPARRVPVRRRSLERSELSA